MPGALAEKGFFDALMGGNAQSKAFWPHVLRFNEHPLPARAQTDAAWFSPALDAWLSQVPDSLREPPSSASKPAFFWDFQEDSRKLALLDDSRLELLAKVSGVTLHAREMAKIVEREARLALTEVLGKKLVEYALARGQYQTGAAGAIVDQLHTDLPLVERCRLHGWLALHLCASRWPELLRERFVQRLSGMCHEVSYPGDVLAETDWQAIWRMLKKCLLREVAPSWAAYFTV